MNVTRSTDSRPREERVAAAVDRLYAALEGNRATRFPWAVVRTFSDGHGALLAGSMAYYTFLSLLPLLLLAGVAVGTMSVGDVQLRDALATAVERLLPGAEGHEVVRQLINARVAFGVLGVVTVFYGGSGFVGALTACLNRMWRVPSGRNPIGQRFLNFGIVIMLGVVLLGSIGVTIWVGYVTRVVLDGNVVIARVVDAAVSPTLIFIVVVLLYAVLPARRVRVRSQLPGAVVAAVGVDLLKRGFAYWAQHSAGVSALPRSLVSVVLLLIWMGFFGQIILYGAAINVVLEQRRLERPGKGADGARG